MNKDQTPDPGTKATREQVEEYRKVAMRHLLRTTMAAKRAEEILRRNNIAASIIGGKRQ